MRGLGRKGGEGWVQQGILLLQPCLGTVELESGRGACPEEEEDPCGGASGGSTLALAAAGGGSGARAKVPEAGMCTCTGLAGVVVVVVEVRQTGGTGSARGMGMPG